MAKLNTGIKKDKLDMLFTPTGATPNSPNLEVVEKTSSDGIETVDISKLKPFSNHTFKMYEGEKLQGLVDSIKENGIISPILVRPIKDNEYDYEIVAGHNRVEACKVAGFDKIPAVIKELTNEESTIMMVDSNLQQREGILPSEKAFSYKAKLDAMKSQGKRSDLTSGQVDQKLKKSSRDEIADSSLDSSKNIQRYIRLTHLDKSLLNKVDDKKMAFIPAVELSYLTKKEQGWLYDILKREEKFGVPMKQASTLKGMSQSKQLSYEKIDKVITDKVSNSVSAFKVPYKKVSNFFDKSITPKEFEETIVKALEMYFENEQLQDIAR